MLFKIPFLIVPASLLDLSLILMIALSFQTVYAFCLLVYLFVVIVVKNQTCCTGQ